MSVKIWLRVEGFIQDKRSLWQRILNRDPLPYQHDEEITGGKIVTLVARSGEGQEFIWRQRPGSSPLIPDLKQGVN